MNVIAVVPPGLEEICAKELLDLGATSTKSLRRCVEFQVDQRFLYRIHLQARLPFRFLREIARFQCNGPKDLYHSIQNSFDWKRWLHPTMTFRVDVTGSNPNLPHTHFTALQVKNALIDFQRDLWGYRSNIDLDQPDLCLHLHISNFNNVILSLASSAKSLHRRGYHPAMGLAPLKENLAAGLLRITGWDASVPLVDPLCGSGTFLIEAANIALGVAPGLNQSFLLQGWADFDQELWKEEEQLSINKKVDFQDLPLIIGCEQNLEIAKQAKSNINSAGLEGIINIQVGHFRDILLPDEKGILVCNPPYGKRISSEDILISLYQELGQFCKLKAKGWDLWILNGNPNLSQFIRMRSSKRFPISNGGIDCRWLHYKIN